MVSFASCTKSRFIISCNSSDVFILAFKQINSSLIEEFLLVIIKQTTIPEIKAPIKNAIKAVIHPP